MDRREGGSGREKESRKDRLRMRKRKKERRKREEGSEDASKAHAKDPLVPNILHHLLQVPLSPHGPFNFGAITGLIY